MNITRLILAGALTALSASAWAQPYAITWFSIDSGGTAAVSAGAYTLGGTVGQPDAGFLSAGGLACLGGYWGAAQGATSCYANCDNSTIPPVLNVNDFSCFLNRYAASDPYANCDASTNPPILNVNDFTCFLNRYAAGCP